MDNDIEKMFTYHAPKPGQPELYQAIRDKAKDLAYLIIHISPVSREQSLAITKLEECVFWANAAIARHGKTSEDSKQAPSSINDPVWDFHSLDLT